jgi:hypothetical protein
MEADSLDDKPTPTLTQVDENDLLEPAGNPKPAIILAKAPKLEEKITAVAKTTVDPLVKSAPIPGNVTEITDSVKRELIQTVDLWAATWSSQIAPQYIANYSTDFAVPDQQTRRKWEELRKKRVMLPSYINLDIRYQRFELVDTDVIDVFFRQAYRSNSYSDLTDKVLRLRKENTGWKILIERSI